MIQCRRAPNPSSGSKWNTIRAASTRTASTARSRRRTGRPSRPRSRARAPSADERHDRRREDDHRHHRVDARQASRSRESNIGGGGPQQVGPARRRVAKILCLHRTILLRSPCDGRGRAARSSPGAAGSPPPASGSAGAGSAAAPSCACASGGWGASLCAASSFAAGALAAVASGCSSDCVAPAPLSSIIASASTTSTSTGGTAGGASTRAGDEDAARMSCRLPALPGLSLTMRKRRMPSVIRSDRCRSASSSGVAHVELEEVVLGPAFLRSIG